jgi:hypothetical protein
MFLRHRTTTQRGSAPSLKAFEHRYQQLYTVEATRYDQARFRHSVG